MQLNPKQLKYLGLAIAVLLILGAIFMPDEPEYEKLPKVDLKSTEEEKYTSLNEYGKFEYDFKKDCSVSRDGSIYGFNEMVKNTLNDPESFEDVETRHSYKKDKAGVYYADVILKFRAKNGFGGVITSYANAKIYKGCMVKDLVIR